VKRREFIAWLAGAVASAPLAARAQQADKIRRIAVLMGVAETEEGKAWVAAFQQRLEQLGWATGRNVSFEVRWWMGGPEQMRTPIASLLAFAPDVIMVSSNFAVSLLKPMAQNVPIVFAHLGDPVGSGFVANLAHPGGNITGFSGYDGTMGGKWLEVLKETVPRLDSVMTIFQPETPVHQGLWRSIKEAAPQLGVEAVPGGVHNAAEIESRILSFATTRNGGIIVLPHAITNANESLITALALRHRLPTLYSTAGAVRAGGLVSYSYDLVEAFRNAAGYVDRILRGANPGDLPVQQPTKFELVVSLKTAKAIGVDISPSLLARADEVIE
jgi:putative tryptophan/tyrosine transport system substrate-binding protein